MPLHIDYRPRTLDEVIGNDDVRESIKSVFGREDRPHTFLFIGPSGCGKTTMGRIIAKMAGCSNYDFKEYNAANTRGIETIREISQTCHYAGMESKVKVYLIDECHQLTGPAAEATLKILEDTPPHVYFILCTTEPEKLSRTMLTRCTTYQMRLLSNEEINKLINWVLISEGLSNSFSKEVIKEIVRVSEGCPRQALVILDQVIDIEDEKKAMKAVSTISVGSAEVIEICRLLLQGTSWEVMKDKVKMVLQGTESEKLRYAIIGYMSAVLLNSKSNDRASNLIDLFGENTYSTGKPGIVNMIYLACGK